MTLNNAQWLEPALPPLKEQAAASEPRILPDFDRDVWCILGLPFDRVSLEQACSIMRESAAHQRRCFLSTPNLNFAIACMDDAAFRNSVIRSDLSIADGMPLVWIARAIGLPIRERVAGSSLFQALRRPVAGSAAQMRVYFFGGPPGVAETAAERLNAEASGMRSVGFASPGFGTIEQMSDAETIDRINDSRPDFVVVALGAKKGQAWIEHNLKRLRAPLISHLGAVVNFVAGTVSRAPVWAQKTGLEWLWRIKEEPKLWRRYRDDGVALLRLLAWRVLPCVLETRRRRPAPAEFDQAGMVCRRDRGDCELLLSGALGTANIGKLRQVLREAAAADEPLVLDCAELKHIDSAALAALMLLYGDCVARYRPWAIIRPSEGLRRQFHLHCAEYLLQPLA